MPKDTPRFLLLLIFVSALCRFQISGACAETPFDAINADASRSHLTVQPVRGSISVIMGTGGNITVLTGPDGKFMVDAGITLSRTRLSEILDSLSSMQVEYVVNTHWHWDHSDGDAWLRDHGATIISHKSTLKHLTSTIQVEEWGHIFAPVAESGRPTELLEKQRKLFMDRQEITIDAYPPSHTDGDLYVHFRNADVLATGDTYWNGIYPFIDYVAGGGIDGMIKAANENIAMTTDHTIVVPGHGPLAKRADLVEFRDMLVAIRGNVASLKRKGMTLDQVIATKPTAFFDAKWGQSIITPALFTSLVYRGIPQKK